MAAQYTIIIHRDCDFTRSFQVKRGENLLDITGHTFTGKLAKNYHTDSTTAFTGATVGSASDGTFSITLTDTQTAALSAGTYVYSVVMADAGGIKTKLLEGECIVEDTV